MSVWFTRPIFFVADVERALAFYVDKLGFTVAWRFDEEGRAFVAQVDREDCELILNGQFPERVGKGRLFVSIDLEPLNALRAEFEGRGAATKDGWWGYDTMIVEDPDGNELYFPYPKVAEAPSQA